MTELNWKYVLISQKLYWVTGYGSKVYSAHPLPAVLQDLLRMQLA